MYMSVCDACLCVSNCASMCLCMPVCARMCVSLCVCISVLMHMSACAGRCEHVSVLVSVSGRALSGCAFVSVLVHVCVSFTADLAQTCWQHYPCLPSRSRPALARGQYVLRHLLCHQLTLLLLLDWIFQSHP